MSAPRLEVDLDKIEDNARRLVGRLGARGISVTGVTKATLGSPEIAAALLGAGVVSLGDSRIENIEAMRRTHRSTSMVLIRSPMLSQVERVVRSADVSFNSELEVIRSLSAAAGRAGRVHAIVLMVELGDLREGVLPRDLEALARSTLCLPGLTLRGIGTNLACRSGVTPDAANMSELSALAESLEGTFGLTLDLVTGGNSANLDWVLGDPGIGERQIGRINNLRLGEAILLGREPLYRRPIEGLHTDAMTLVGEVIESKVKPTRPSGTLASAAFGVEGPVIDRGCISQTICGLGRQDTDPGGLRAPVGIQVLGASSDHLILDSGSCLSIGAEVAFQLSYGALIRSMTSPFVAKVMKRRGHDGFGARYELASERNDCAF